MNELQTTKWHRELQSFKGIKSTFIIEGNIYDKYPWRDPKRPRVRFLPLNEYLASVFDDAETAGAYSFIYYDPAMGFFDPQGRSALADRLAKMRQMVERKKQIKRLLNPDLSDSESKTVNDSELIRTVMTEEVDEREGKSVAIVLNFASRFLSSPSNLSNNEISLFLNLQYASNHAIAGTSGFVNTLILVVDEISDIPGWFHQNSPDVRQITIPNPNRALRDMFLAERCPGLSGNDEHQRERLADLTDGMKIAELEDLSALYEREKTHISNISEVVSIYKYGFRENKWLQIREKLKGLDMAQALHQSVKGQNEAVSKVLQVIKRSVVGLSGLQHSSNTKPRGILFLVGPTGTGKTELVKAVTRLLFEDERALIRFDMSEYGEEHSDQKLFGAPPGYVGYGRGGQLTNAVKNNPFSVLLFDEIEKAHPSIMDKFLQILEDGRMTDGEGNTVSFTETLIFFTSNKGISEEITDPVTGKICGRENIVQPGTPYQELRSTVMNAVKTYFKPEIIGRIGESNIVVFDFIAEAVADEILDTLISKIHNEIRKSQGIDIVLEDRARQHLRALCMHKDVIACGGRGIGTQIESCYLDPIGAAIFDAPVTRIQMLRITEKDGALVYEVVG